MDAHINLEKGAKKLIKIKTRECSEKEYDSNTIIHNLGMFMIKNKFKALEKEPVKVEKKSTDNADSIKYLMSKLMNLHQAFKEKMSKIQQLELNEMMRLEKTDKELRMMDLLRSQKSILLQNLNEIEQYLHELKIEFARLNEM